MLFFKKNKGDSNNKNLVKITALLIHAARIDENFSEIEKKIIKKSLLKFGASSDDLEIIMKKAKEIEENSNQILDFTKEVKSFDNEDKIKIIETLWEIIYSNNEADMFENNLMRRLGGLLYIDNKTIADIKEKIKKDNSL